MSSLAHAISMHSKMALTVQACRMPKQSLAFSHHEIFECQSERRIHVKLHYYHIGQSVPFWPILISIQTRLTSTNLSHPVQRKKSRKINRKKYTDISRNSGRFAQFPRCTINISAAALCALKILVRRNENHATKNSIWLFISHDNN